MEKNSWLSSEGKKKEKEGQLCGVSPVHGCVRFGARSG
jgi:hypothetical protein